MSTTKVKNFYPAEDVQKRRKSSKTHHKPTRLRKSITPGTVLILLSGRFRGKRCVCLQQLPSGLLLVTGPFRYNGIPLRRVNQAYVIATSTKVDVSSVSIPESVNDSFFKREKKAEKKGEEEFFSSEEKKKQIPEEKIKIQKEVDAAVMKEIEKTPLLKQYIQSRFTLRNTFVPHEMKF